MTEKEYDNVRKVFCDITDDFMDCNISVQYTTLEGIKYRTNRETIKELDIGFNSLEDGNIMHKKRRAPNLNIFTLRFRDNTICSIMDNEILKCEWEK